MSPRVKQLGLWIMIATLSVATLTLYVDNSRTRDCIANYMVKDQKSSATRTDLADTERKQFKLTLQTIFNPTSTATERSNAGNVYIDLLDRDDQIRAQNPVAPVPTDCS